MISFRSRSRSRSRWAGGGAFALLLGCLACTGQGPTGGQQRPDPLPPDGFLEAWRTAGERALFTGPDLYNHIDGGAEVFLELGFDRVEVQRYAAGDAELAVELYHMRDPLAALGIYLMKCGSETPSPNLAARHTVNAYQVQLCSGPAYVVVNRLAGDELDPEVMVAFARHVSEQLGSADPLDPFGALPEAGRIAGSERVVRGPYTLEALFTFGQGDVLQLGERGVTAFAAEYREADGSTSTRLRFPYADPGAAAAVFASLAQTLDPELEVLGSSGDRLAFKDYAGLYGELVLAGAVIEARVGLAQAPAATSDSAP